jgi:hypothetical protein
MLPFITRRKGKRYLNFFLHCIGYMRGGQQTLKFVLLAAREKEVMGNVALMRTWRGFNLVYVRARAISGLSIFLVTVRRDYL